MKVQKKIIIFLSIVTFLIVSVIAGRAFIGKKIQAKIAQAKKAPVGVIATKVSYFSFYDQIDTFGTAIANQSFSIRIKKDNKQKIIKKIRIRRQQRKKRVRWSAASEVYKRKVHLLELSSFPRNTWDL